MPVYEYGCEAGHRFEVKQRMSDAAILTCPVCNLPVSKLISAPGISFKGSGWYVTDYSNKLKPSAAEEKSDKPAVSHESKKDTPTPQPSAGGDTGGPAQSPSSTPAPKPESSSPSTSNSGPTTSTPSPPSRPPSEK